VIRQPVASSSIRTIGHDPGTNELHVEFASGACYAYKNVPQALFDKLLTAESIGNAFHHLVKKGGFPFEKLSAEARQ
jgi:hypothetical protein